MRTVAKMWLVLAAFVLLPSAAYAQASITGVVRDTSGAVLPGVTAEAASPALIEKVRTAVTDGTGQYRIENLRPGVYTVTFTLPGFSTAKREGVELAGTFTATVNAELRVGALEETVTVTGESPTVDVQNTIRQRVMDRAVIDAIPIGRTGRDLAQLIPGVSIGAVGAQLGGGQGITQDVGGAFSDRTSSMTVHGSRPADQRILINGVSVNISVQGGGYSGGTNLAGYQEVTVDTAGGSEMATGGVLLNYIPKEGGNSFRGSVFGSFANDAMQGNNYTQDLKDRGLRTPTALKRVWDIAPEFGGPIIRDRLWFHTTARNNRVENYPAGTFYNLNANNPNIWTYAPDLTRRPFNKGAFSDEFLRLTWQATPRNKIGAEWQELLACDQCPSNSAILAPESSTRAQFRPQRNLMADWTSPVTNRVLLEAGALRRVERYWRRLSPDTGPSMISVVDQGLGNLRYRAPDPLWRGTNYWTMRYRAAASYITGAHAFKVGALIGQLADDSWIVPATQPVEYRFNNGVPNQITLHALPNVIFYDIDADSAVFAQDKWTIGRLTLSYGVRYDHFRNSFPEQTHRPGPLVPTRNITYPAAPGVSWHDISPRTGVAYDLFGTGRTALKVTLNKYLEGMGNQGVFGSAQSATNRAVLNTTRSWNDANRNFVPDCDLISTAANGECGAMANANFGKPVSGATYDPETVTGWGKRAFNWEFSAGVQHELVPRVAVDVSYFRRWFGNFIVTDNRAVSASDFTTFSLAAPTSDPRLPTAGSVITGFHDLNPARFGVPADNYITFAKNYGKQTERWNGVDVIVNARPGPDVLVQGGVSTGRAVNDNCEVAAKVPEVLLIFGVWTPRQYCHQEQRFLTQVKALASYTVPKIDVLLSGTFQSVPGPSIVATWAAPNAVVAPALGRNLSGNAANTTVHLLSPGSLYNQRMNEVDLRVGKILRFGRTRTTVSLDVYNALNGSTVLLQNNTFGGAIPWQRPQAILTARFAKVSVLFDF